MSDIELLEPRSHIESVARQEIPWLRTAHWEQRNV
jgi:hypothetical protein